MGRKVVYEGGMKMYRYVSDVHVSGAGAGAGVSESERKKLEGESETAPVAQSMSEDERWILMGTCEWDFSTNKHIVKVDPSEDPVITSMTLLGLLDMLPTVKERLLSAL
eukprot:GABW01002622.1.p2 GENE.GABW01002622.1~~GABW01002622.1.p2  ORF type:complete len:109 (-),score=26.46 GABW01002622.1:43-369(-)